MVLDEWTRVLPEAETEAVMVRATSEIKYDAKDDKALDSLRHTVIETSVKTPTDNSDDLDGSKDELSFSICP